MRNYYIRNDMNSYLRERKEAYILYIYRERESLSDIINCDFVRSVVKFSFFFSLFSMSLTEQEIT